jgi:hypothetical protein
MPVFQSILLNKHRRNLVIGLAGYCVAYGVCYVIAFYSHGTGIAAVKLLYGFLFLFCAIVTTRANALSFNKNLCIRLICTVLAATIVAYSEPWLVLDELQRAAANFIGYEIAIFVNIFAMQTIYSLCIVLTVSISGMLVPVNLKIYVIRMILLVFCCSALLFVVVNLEILVFEPIASGINMNVVYFTSYLVMQVFSCILFYFIVVGFMGKTRPLRAFDRLASFASGSREPSRRLHLPLIICMGASVLLAGLAALLIALDWGEKQAALGQALPLLETIEHSGEGGAVRQLGAVLEVACYALLLLAYSLIASRASKVRVSGAGVAGLLSVCAAVACLLWLKPLDALFNLTSSLHGNAYAALNIAKPVILALLVSVFLALALFNLTDRLPKRIVKAAFAAVLMALAGAAMRIFTQSFLLFLFLTFALVPAAAAALSSFALGALGMLIICLACYPIAFVWARLQEVDPSHKPGHRPHEFYNGDE